MRQGRLLIKECIKNCSLMKISRFFPFDCSINLVARGEGVEGTIESLSVKAQQFHTREEEKK